MNIRQCSLSIFLLSVSHLCFADYVFQLGYATGGDKVGTVVLVDEDGDSSTETIRFGSGFNIGFGGVVELSDNIELQSTFNYKEDAVRADKSLSFKRMPIDALVFYKDEHFRFGVGLVYELNPKSSGFSPDADCDNATGTAFELGYKWTTFALGVRSTQLEYDCKANYLGLRLTGSPSGDNTAVQATWRF